MTLLAIAGAERTKAEVDRAIPALLSHVQAAGTVAAFAPHLGELRTGELAAVSGRRAKSVRVTGDAFGIGIGLLGDQCGERVRMARAFPHLGRRGVTGFAC